MAGVYRKVHPTGNRPTDWAIAVHPTYAGGGPAGVAHRDTDCLVIKWLDDPEGVRPPVWETLPSGIRELPRPEVIVHNLLARRDHVCTGSHGRTVLGKRRGNDAHPEARGGAQ